jgi:putative membrane protein insertion efficiency factor
VSWKLLPRRLLVLMIVGYQRLLSPRLGRNCRFLPTCSQYAREAIEVHGALRGVLLGLGRLLRCHPLHPGGYDPVTRS